MALPQQGTETNLLLLFLRYQYRSVNGLTPTGDGNVLLAAAVATTVVVAC